MPDTELSEFFSFIHRPTTDVESPMLLSMSCRDFWTSFIDTPTLIYDLVINNCPENVTQNIESLKVKVVRHRQPWDFRHPTVYIIQLKWKTRSQVTRTFHFIHRHLSDSVNSPSYNAIIRDAETETVQTTCGNLPQVLKDDCIRHMPSRYGTTLPDDSEVVIQRTPHRHYFSVTVTSTEGTDTQPTTRESKKPMLKIPNHIRPYFSEPPEHVKERVKDKIHLFLEVQSDLRYGPASLKSYGPASLKSGAINYKTMLTEATSHASHPKIPQGYYDTKRNNTLFVKDVNGKSIPKHETVLTSKGTFIRRVPKTRDNYKILENVKSVPPDLIFKAKKGDEKALKELSSMYVEVSFDRNRIFVQLEPEMFVLVTGVGKHVLNTYFINHWKRFYKDFTGIEEVRPLDFDEMTQEVYENFVQYCKAKESDLETRYVFKLASSNPQKTLYTFPETSDFFGGRTIDLGHPEYVRALQRPQEERGEGGGAGVTLNMELPQGFYVYGSPTPLQNHMSEESPYKSLRELGIRANMPFDLFVVFHPDIIRSDEMEPKPTRNNRGELLNYTADVTKFKPSFMTTDLEKKQFNYQLSVLKAQRKTYLKEKAQLTRVLVDGRAETKDRRAARQRLLELKPPKIPYGNQPVWLGWELEVVPRSNENTYGGRYQIIKDIADTPVGDYSIIKSDSSIGENGLEIVSTPATLSFHRELIQEHLFPDRGGFRKRVMSTPLCGIHIHISKKAFTKMSIGKFITFINTNYNSDFINDIAGRTPNEYCIKLPLKGKNAHGIEQSISIANNINMTESNEHLPRRGAINLRKKHTIEVRIFKATNDKNNLIRKLEFCHALTMFCREAAPSELNTHHFINFVLRKDNRKEYKYLIRWLASKDYIEHEMKKVKGDVTKVVHIYGNNKVPLPRSTR